MLCWFILFLNFVYPINSKILNNNQIILITNNLTSIVDTKNVIQSVLDKYNLIYKIFNCSTNNDIIIIIKFDINNSNLESNLHVIIPKILKECDCEFEDNQEYADFSIPKYGQTMRVLDNIFLSSNKKTTLEKYLSVKYKYWKNGIKGEKIKVAILDSGISKNYTHCNISDFVNFTDESDEDLNGHGTFITSLICDSYIGISPHSEMYIYKVFDKRRKTFTSWLLQGLNSAINNKVDIINLSFGGINFNDRIISSKIEEAVSLGILIVSSAGNDGPSFGSINFPGNLPYVITVGATNEDIFQILDISSRGPAIYKKDMLVDKPNTWVPGKNIIGVSLNGNYTMKEGTSVSSAIVTGYLSLLLSKFPTSRSFFNIGSMLLLLKESNLYNPSINRGELISGIFNIDGLMELSKYHLDRKHKLNSQILNNVIDLSMKFYSNYTISETGKKDQAFSLYSSMQPIYFTVIFINPNFNSVNKINYNYEIHDQNKSDATLCVKLVPNQNNKIFYFSNFIGLLHMKLTVDSNLKCRFFKESLNLNIYFDDAILSNKLELKLILDIIPTPSRYSRILINRFNNLYYPFDGYIPRDNLLDNWYNYDWMFESIDTNYFGLYKSLRELNFYVEELNESLDCVDLSEYSVLINVDTEKKLTESEIEKLKYENQENHLSVFIITEWNQPLVKSKIEIKDLESWSVEIPKTDGGEITSLNNFLFSYGIEIGSDSISRDFKLSTHVLKIKSGSSISKFPSNSYLFGNLMKNDLALLDSKYEIKYNRAILGLINKIDDKPNSGRIAIYTDTYCMDDYQLRLNQSENCFWLMGAIIKYLIHGNFVHSELQLKNKFLLEVDYNDKSKKLINISEELSSEKNVCSNKNYTLDKLNFLEYIKYNHNPTAINTDVVPNIIQNNSFEYNDNDKSEEKENKLIDVLEDLIYVVVPIFTIILVIVLILYLNKKKVKKNRNIVYNLSQIKQYGKYTNVKLNESKEFSNNDLV